MLRSRSVKTANGASPDAALAAVIKTPDKGRMAVLDLLRFAAALLVLSYHLIPEAAYSFDTEPDQYWPQPVLQLSRYGWMGVELFFLISGFVICMSSWGRTISQFFISRVTRLWPAYLLAVVLTAVVLTLWPAPGKTGPQLSQVLANLTMVHTLRGIAHIDPVYWSLLLELKFYLLFSVVVAAGLTYSRVVLFCAVWTTASLFAQAANVRFLIELLDPQYTPYFVAGVTLYLMHHYGQNLVLWGMLATSWLLASASLNVTIAAKIKGGEHVNFTMAFLLLTVFFLVMVAVALKWFSWMRWRGLVVVGSLTYPVYLLHYSLGKTALRELGDQAPHWLLLAGVPAGILALAYLTYRLVERPGSAVLRRGLKAGFDDIRRQSRERVEPLAAAPDSGPRHAYVDSRPGPLDSIRPYLHVPRDAAPPRAEQPL